MQENKVSRLKTCILNPGGTNGFTRSEVVIHLIFPPGLNI